MNWKPGVGRLRTVRVSDAFCGIARAGRAQCCRPALLLLLLLAWMPAPGVEAAEGLRIEAETAAVRTVGAPWLGSWVLTTVGMAADAIRVDEGGHFRILVRAKATPCREAWPMATLVVDGFEPAYRMVDRRTWEDYIFEVELDPGLHMVGVSFPNDSMEGLEDRNLYIDYLEVTAVAGAAPVKAPYHEWLAQEQKREEEALDAARAAISGVRTSEARVTVTDPDGNPLPEVTVDAVLERHAFLFGANILMFGRFGSPLENRVYKQRFEELFNFATIGFYWKAFELEKGKARFSYTDEIVQWCREHNITPKGHPLLWNYDIMYPAWSEGFPPEAEQRARVESIVTHYKDDIRYWDVVNEPSRLGGVDLEKAYRWAHEANPEAALLVNDFGILPGGYPAFYELLEGLIAKGVRVDAVGMQAHAPPDAAFPLHWVRRVLDQYGKLGRPVHITEFLPISSGIPVTMATWRGKWDEDTQAAYARDFYTLCFAHPAVEAITWWDLSDAGAWLQGGGLLREDLTKKPVYDALHKLLHETWHTREAGTTDEKGRFAFAGFQGTYRVAAEKDGKTAEGVFELGKNGAELTLELE